MIIVVFELDPKYAAFFERLEKDHSLRVIEEPLSQKNAGLHADADVICTFVRSQLTAKILGEFPRLQMIATRSTGFDHIALDYCGSRGIAICNVPAYGANTVAEHAFGLLLALSHRLDQAMSRVRGGQFGREGLEGFDLHGRTLGVIGAGHIGRAMLRIAHGFGMTTLANDVEEDSWQASGIGYRYVDFGTLLKHSDVISLHVPSTARTRGLIGDAEFEQMRDGVILLNTARGDVIDQAAFAHALATGRVGAAGLDVLPDEPLLHDATRGLDAIDADEATMRRLLATRTILSLPNVVTTPHSAYYTREAVDRMMEATVANILAFASGVPQNLAA